MSEYKGAILLAALVFGFVPIALVIVYCLLTGRAGALFCDKNEDDLQISPVLRKMMRIYVISLPVYAGLLCVYAFLDLS